MGKVEWRQIRSRRIPLYTSSVYTLQHSFTDPIGRWLDYALIIQRVYGLTNERYFNNIPGSKIIQSILTEFGKK